jgi:hypothetical protein
MNFANIESHEIYEWNCKQLCAALIEAKKIDKLVNEMKDILRERLTNGTVINTSNGKVKIGRSAMSFTYEEQNVDDRYLLEPVRPLNKNMVRACLTDSGQLPEGVKVKYSKKTVTVSPN